MKEECNKCGGPTGVVGLTPQECLSPDCDGDARSPARQEGETPRTDNLAKELEDSPVNIETACEHLMDHARTLERELSAKQAEVERLTVAKRSAEELWQVQVNRTNSARAELESLKAAQGWRSIETAPKKGIIDIWTGVDRIANCKWDANYEAFCAQYGQGNSYRMATHWMPLPTPPVERSENKG